MQIDKMNEKQAIKNAIKMAGHTDDEERTNGKVTLEYFQVSIAKIFSCDNRSAIYFDSLPESFISTVHYT